jgi:hypothetical protein
MFLKEAVHLIVICVTVIGSARFPLTEQGEHAPVLNYLSTVPEGT